MRIRNFLFHRVSDEVDELWPPMPPKYFDNVIRILTRKYEVVPLEHYLDDPSAFKTKKKIATVLFDDGYKDNIENAAPILKKYNCPASFYVVSDCIDKNLPTWTYILDHVFQNTSVTKLEIPFDWLPVDKKRIDFQTESDRKKFGAWLKPAMKKMTNTQRTAIFDHVVSTFSDVEIPRSKMMDWRDINELKNDGHIIGSHTVTHPLLASIESEDELDFELTRSAARVREETGSFPKTISYPIGSYSKTVKDRSKRAGYTYGLVVDEKFYDPRVDDLFQIPRVELYPETSWKRDARMTGTMELIKRFLR